MSAVIDRGRAGERALSEWLGNAGLSYVAVCQSPDTFAPLFSNEVKRPDFLVLLDSIGLIAVDAKNYTLNGGGYTLNFEAELRRSLAFERLFRIPLWYAYLDSSDQRDAWFWISALKAVEVGEQRENAQTREKFLFLQRNQFEFITEPQDLARLFTHRLPSVSRIAAASLP